MPLLFEEYELLARSGLFDAEYYRNTNLDVAMHNVDPLLHYLESGWREGRNPNAMFDTSHYLAQCSVLGEKPDNALVHYLTVGADRGLTTGSAARPKAMLWVDVPRCVNGAAAAPVRGGLSVVGWGLAPGCNVHIEIAVDGTRIKNIRSGLRRPDVAAAHPNLEGALSSGYNGHVAPNALAAGGHQVTVSLLVDDESVARVEFSVEVQNLSDARGPWALRRRMRRAEVELQFDILKRLNWRPHFRVVLELDERPTVLGDAMRTIETLARQEYAQWEVQLTATAGKACRSAQRKSLLRALKAGMIDIPQQITLLQAKRDDAASAARDPRAASVVNGLVILLRPGDLLGCDALLEFAVASGLDRRGDLFYSDERRPSPVDGAMDAFFKPGWSPDLLLSSNYIGRAWCARQGLLNRAGLTVSQLAALADYDAILRLTEHSRQVHPVSRVLFQRASARGDSAVQERRALTGTLVRRGIDADVKPGCAPGHYRVKHRVQGGRVSIIIPTRAASGLIKTCIETLRGLTVYRDYEIICVENIAPPDAHWKHWLGSHADLVIGTQASFNWSKFNNLATRRASGKYLLFLNDDIEIIDPYWLSALLEHAQRPAVGVVGPQLLYPDRSVQHAGVMLDAVGRGRHAFRHLADNDPGYFGLALTQRNVLSVTGACLMTRRDTFEALSGFDEAHAVINNDLDYCLKAWRKGLLTVYTPYARLVHHELASRSGLSEQYDAAKFQQRWAAVVASGDPYFNPNLSRDLEQFTIEREPFEIVHAGRPLFVRDAVRRILVVKLDHIGDSVTALPALRRMKRYFPAARIALLAGASTRSIWAGESCVDEIIEFNFFNSRSALGQVEVTARQFGTLGDVLRRKQFDLAIDLRKQPDTRHILHLSGAEILVGFDNQGRFPWLDVALEWDEDVPLRTKHGHVSDDLVALVEAVATHSDLERPAIMAPAAGPLPLSRSRQKRLFAKPLVCVHPAAGSPMRQWPLERFAQLIDLLIDSGSYHVALIGGHDDREMAAGVLASVRNDAGVFDLVDTLSLEKLPRLLSKAALFVGNNSGPQHIAAALGTPTVGIHSGVIDSQEWGPFGPRAVAVRRHMSCSPCYIEVPKNCPRALACLTELSAADVYGTCKKILMSANSVGLFSHASIGSVP